MDDIITGARGASTGQISEMEAVYRVHLEGVATGRARMVSSEMSVHTAWPSSDEARMEMRAGRVQ